MRWNVAVPAALVAALAAAPVASAQAAAEIATDRGCYQENTPVTVTGNGFEPGQTAEAFLDGKAIPSGQRTVDPTGGVAGQFTPRLPSRGSASRQHTFRLTIIQGTNKATTHFTVTQLRASFSPASGDPARLRVRFSVFGFGLAEEHPVVFLHYVTPGGKARKTVRLGRAHGECGWIRHTARKRLFPFKAAHGDWRLQFDTNRRFRLGTASSRFLFYTLTLRISDGT